MLTALQIQELVKDSEDYNVDIKHSVPSKEFFGEVVGFTNDAGDHILALIMRIKLKTNKY